MFNAKDRVANTKTGTIGTVLTPGDEMTVVQFDGYEPGSGITEVPTEWLDKVDRIRVFNKSNNETLWIIDLKDEQAEDVFQAWRTRNLHWLQQHVIDRFTYEVI